MNNLLYIGGGVLVSSAIVHNTPIGGWIRNLPIQEQGRSMAGPIEWTLNAAVGVYAAHQWTGAPINMQTVLAAGVISVGWGLTRPYIFNG